MLISDVAAPLRVVASAEDGSVEAVRHNTLPWVGIMWHPEREPTFRSEELALLRNMFNAGR
jgi:putative glutamine amidotransferase